MRKITVGVFIFAVLGLLATLPTRCPAQAVPAVVSTALLAADWSTTAYGVRHGGVEELNLLLGRHPSIGRLNTYMASCIVGNLLLGRALPRSIRTLYWTSIAAFESAVVLHNWRIGLRFELNL